MFETMELAIFDMDGLMLDSEIEYYREQLKTCEEHGFKVDPSKLIEAIGSREFDLEGFFCGSVPQEERQGGHLLDDALQRAVDRMCAQGAPLKPGVRELTDGLRGQRIPMVIATSTPRAQAQRLMESTGLMERFIGMVTFDEVPRSKPAPDLFLKACDLGKVSPERAVIFEDSENGALAAQNAGIPYVLVPDLAILQPREKEKALMTAGSLLDVWKEIKKERKIHE
jgi:HAD superfamily hydrolase (TIGR01509 family)